jgi:hypothetical protein
MKGFMRLLKKGVPFCWDEATQRSFDALKKALVSTPLLSPPDYNQYFLLYLVATKSSIGMVLVQEDDELQEHVIYYLSRALLGPKLKYSHVEKLALETFHVVHIFVITFYCARQPSLLIVNPFQYVLTRELSVGSTTNGLWCFKNLTWIFP